MSKQPEQYRGNVRFVDVLQHFLNRGLQSWAGQPLNSQTMGEMYSYIREGVHDLFAKSSQNLTSDTKDWISQQLYMSIRVGSTSDLIRPDGSHLHEVAQVFEPTDIKRIPTDELRIVGSILSDCDFATEIAGELRRRSR